ncbi:hybrid sensor histidine kinase/response regulator [Ornithinibacillus bavariensis]|uniref:ATP-binding response regulator n=1 Tax=Ornithinibacillus bavariensis TaxID=545502 RepID=UPI000EBCA0F6|nr:histidine kinase [Ornithinibacillus sp.]
MKKNKLFFVISIGLFVTILTIIRLIWESFLAVPNHPEAVNGVLDLRDWEFSESQTIRLNGEWDFYPDILLEPSDLNNSEALSGQRELETTENWKSLAKNSAYKVGTYHLRILLHPKDLLETYGFRVNSIPTSSKFFIDGRLLGGSGNPSEVLQDYTPQNQPYSLSYTTDKDHIDVLIQVAHSESSGTILPFKTINFGLDSAVSKETLFWIMIQITVAAILFTLAVYAILLYMIGIKQRVLVYFFLLMINGMLIVLVSDDRLLFEFISLGFEARTRLSILTYSCIGQSLFLFSKHLLPQYAHGKAFKWFPKIGIVYILFVLLYPLKYLERFSFVLSLFMIIAASLIVIIFIRAILDKIDDIIFLLLGGTAVLHNIIWVAIARRLSLEVNFYPWNLLIAVFLFSAFWFKRYFRSVKRTEELTEELIRADHKKDEFLAKTSHELRNPLHVIINIAQSLLENGKNNMGQKNNQDLKLLITVGRRMSLLLNDILDVTRLKENKVQLHKRSINIQSVVTGVIDMLQFMIEDRDIEISNKIPLSFPPVVADENRLVQILINLMHNAIKYTDQGKITISGTIAENEVSIHISDTGIGMEEAILNRIFQPYEQADMDKDVNRGGIGLGLTICKQLIELHGGRLTVESMMEKGSVFTFTLPISSEQNEEKVKESFVNPESEVAATAFIDTPSFRTLSYNRDNTLFLGRTKLLVVDDDSVNLRVLKSILSTDNYNITTVTSGKEALEKINKEQWDLVISDVMMPNMSGYELTEKIRKKYSISELPILLLTARSHPEDLYRGFLSGANDYITKPVEPLELKARVELLTNLKQSITELLKMEAAWLQAQIKPHFLFNTLNTILVLLDHDSKKAKMVFEAFCNFLQTSFQMHNSNAVIPLNDELDLIRSYLTIEKVRFGDRLRYIWDVDNNIDSHVPPLSIQTIVENALNHGILKRPAGGTLHIRIHQVQDAITITVEDDGIGMDEIKLKKILERKANQKNGIGLYNTNKRLKQLYGQGLLIESRPNEGTKVSFTIPINNAQ